MPTQFERLESRQLLAFAAADPGFNQGNAVTLGGDITAGGMVFATPDGGSIVQTGNGEVRRFDRNGKQSRGKATSFGGADGVLGTPSGSMILLPGVGDPRSGRFVTIHEKGTRLQRTLRIYSLKGKLQHTIGTDVLPQLTGSKTDSGSLEPSMAVDSQGRLLIATASGFGLRITRVNLDDGTIDTSFGTDGSTLLSLPPNELIDWYAHLLAFSIGEDDSMIVAGTFRLSSNSGNESARIFKVDAAGHPMSDFGEEGHVDVVYIESSFIDQDFGYTFERETLDFALARDGSVLIATVDTTRNFTEFDADTEQHVTTIQRITAAGTVGERFDLGTPFDKELPTHARFLMEGANALFIASGEQGNETYVQPDQTQSARVYRFAVAESDVDVFTFDSALGGQLGALVPHAFELTDAARYDDGRLLVLGQRARFDNSLQPELLSLDLDAAQPITQPNIIRLRGDGLLQINGDASADVINVRMKAGYVIVAHLSSVSKFDARRVTGVLIQGLGGNDLITLGTSLRTAHVQGGDGNDTVYGSDRGDLIEGNHGNDYLDGNSGDDLLYGAGDKDVLLGREGADSLYGGTGSDAIYGKDVEPNYEFHGNLLVGGPGSDRLVRAKHTRGDDQDQVIDDGMDIIP